MKPYVFMIMLLMGIGCSAWAIAGPVQIGAAEDGQDVKLGQGQELVVQLEANPTTGYQWILAEGGKAILKQEGAPVYTAKTHSPLIMGAGGIETWRFRATYPGREVLRFEYRRPWEKDKPPERVMRFNVVVR